MSYGVTSSKCIVSEESPGNRETMVLRDPAGCLCHAHSKPSECLIHCIKGISLGLLVAIVPYSIKRRQLSGVRSGVALGALFGSFRALDCIIWMIRNILEKSQLKESLLYRLLEKYAMAIAGGLSVVPALLIDRSMLLNSTAIIWLLVRAVRSYVPNYRFGPLLVMCISAAQIVSTWIRAPQEINPSYLRFLYYASGKKPSVFSIFEDKISNPLMPKMCDVVHSGVSCHMHAFLFFLKGLKLGLPLYLPVHLFSLLMAKNKSPKVFIENMMRSCSFVSLYVTLAYVATCYFFRSVPGITRTRLFMCGWLPGLAVLLEHPGRQKELAAYCLTQALDILYHHLKLKKWVKPNDWIGALLLIGAVGSIMQNHQYQPQLLTKYLFGINSKVSSH